MSLDTNLEIDGLTELQFIELKSVLSEFEKNCIVKKEHVSLMEGRQGEPALVGVIVDVTPIVLSALALWMAKQKSRRIEKLRISRTDGKGGTETIEFDRRSYEEGENSKIPIKEFLQEALDEQ